MDEVHPDFLRALDVAGLSWLTRFCNIARILGAVPLDWHTGVVVPLFNQRVGFQYRGFTLLSLPGKVCSGSWRREPMIKPGHGRLDQFFTFNKDL